VGKSSPEGFDDKGGSEAATDQDEALSDKL
jgi:hypothetical protein